MISPLRIQKERFVISVLFLLFMFLPAHEKYESSFSVAYQALFAY
jgi:hypothetical protein